jgi:Lar family restriction alleviation protein
MENHQDPVAAATAKTTNDQAVDAAAISSPCPFCGCRDVGPESHVNNDRITQHYIRCDDCGASGPFHPMMEIAIRLWNGRALVEENT